MLIGIVNREFKSIAENGPRPKIYKKKGVHAKQYNDNLIETDSLGVMEEKNRFGPRIHQLSHFLNNIDEESIKQFAIDLQKLIISRKLCK